MDVSIRCKKLFNILDGVHSPDFVCSCTSTKVKKSVLGKDEEEQFLSDAQNLYVNAIKDGLEKSPFPIYESCSLSTDVRVLHTGSIVEKFGAPRQAKVNAMALDDIDHPSKLLQSDHDMMFVLENLVVCNQVPNINNCTLEVKPRPENDYSPGHFVEIVARCPENRKVLLKNSTVNNHLYNIVRETFMSNRKSSLREKLLSY